MDSPAVREDGIKSMKLYHQVDRVFNELLALGIGQDDPLDIDVLSRFDQYHYLGTDAVNEAVKRIDIDSSMNVLEIGGGIGGPSRYLAYASGCRVTALELQPDLNETAIALTKRIGLENRVTHLCGDALDGVPGNPQFDALVSWLTFLHIPDRKRLYRQCFKNLKPGAGLYVEDYFERGRLTGDELESLSKQVFCNHVPSMKNYQSELELAGFVDIELVDVSGSWTGFVEERRLAFENNRKRNNNVHGAELVAGLGEFYTTIVNLFQAGNLGGIQVIARRPG